MAIVSELCKAGERRNDGSHDQQHDATGAAASVPGNATTPPVHVVRRRRHRRQGVARVGDCRQAGPDHRQETRGPTAAEDQAQHRHRGTRPAAACSNCSGVRFGGRLRGGIRRRKVQQNDPAVIAHPDRDRARAAAACRRWLALASSFTRSSSSWFVCGHVLCRNRLRPGGAIRRLVRVPVFVGRSASSQPVQPSGPCQIAARAADRRRRRRPAISIHTCRRSTGSNARTDGAGTAVAADRWRRTDHSGGPIGASTAEAGTCCAARECRSRGSRSRHNARPAEDVVQTGPAVAAPAVAKNMHEARTAATATGDIERPAAPASRQVVVRHEASRQAPRQEQCRRVEHRRPDGDLPPGRRLIPSADTTRIPNRRLPSDAPIVPSNAR